MNYRRKCRATYCAATPRAMCGARGRNTWRGALSARSKPAPRGRCGERRQEHKTAPVPPRWGVVGNCWNFAKSVFSETLGGVPERNVRGRTPGGFAKYRHDLAKFPRIAKRPHRERRGADGCHKLRLSLMSALLDNVTLFCIPYLHLFHVEHWLFCST